MNVAGHNWQGRTTLVSTKTLRSSWGVDTILLFDQFAPHLPPRLDQLLQRESPFPKRLANAVQGLYGEYSLGSDEDPGLRRRYRYQVAFLESQLPAYLCR